MKELGEAETRLVVTSLRESMSWRKDELVYERRHPGTYEKEQLDVWSQEAEEMKALRDRLMK